MQDVGAWTEVNGIMIIYSFHVWDMFQNKITCPLRKVNCTVLQNRRIKKHENKNRFNAYVVKDHHKKQRGVFKECVLVCLWERVCYIYFSCLIACRKKASKPAGLGSDALVAPARWEECERTGKAGAREDPLSLPPVALAIEVLDVWQLRPGAVLCRSEPQCMECYCFFMYISACKWFKYHPYKNHMKDP